MPFGNTRLPVAPRPISNCENELKAFGPAIVFVVTVPTAPFVVTVVAVRPSGRMLMVPAGTLCAKVRVGDSTMITAMATAETRSEKASTNKRSGDVECARTRHHGARLHGRRPCEVPIGSFDFTSLPRARTALTNY